MVNSNYSKMQGLILLIGFILSFSFFMSGCSQPSSTASSQPSDQGKVLAIDDDTRIISKLTDGILTCLATNKYKWLEHYTVSDLNGPQVARILAGDAAFDHNITKWNLSEISITYSEDKKAALVSIPVTHIARVKPKHGPQTTIFNFQFIFSEQHQRWLLNIQ